MRDEMGARLDDSRFHGSEMEETVIVGAVNNDSSVIYVLDDMGGPDERFPEKRVAIEVSSGRIGLNRAELEQHIQHCVAALERF